MDSGLFSLPLSYYGTLAFTDLLEAGCPVLPGTDIGVDFLDLWVSISHFGDLFVFCSVGPVPRDSYARQVLTIELPPVLLFLVATPHFLNSFLSRR